ncbi:hypothetical protein SAMN05444358_104205 [Ruegeria halocynthiae]|uniref:Uncharacterized protein n=1 Tax=Ruegeria halocynthiae TaxID=985054 RepID=A0A1H3ALG4_9RHOB|nr:hypothetical protein [Ruegeria halocynthiae]SDX30014.1 hypothetical protein SAMN05444358_104205 [Ruegeria halocynthiae]
MDRAITPLLWAFSQDGDATTGPPPKPMHAPVFIHDAVIPWRDETLLLKLLRDQATDQDE